jgi:hypothetical protein
MTKRSVVYVVVHNTFSVALSPQYSPALSIAK